MNFVGKVLREHNGRLNWPVLIFLIVLLTYAIYEISDGFMPLHGLPSLEERVGSIRKTVNPDDFCFAVLGDHKNDKKVFPAIITIINDDPEISFVIHTGDMVRDPRKIFYQDFLKMVAVRLHKTILLVPGNHDVGGQGDDSLYKHAFGPKHYDFRIGKTHLVFIDTQRIASKSEQTFLRNALNQNKFSENTIMFMHIPLYDPRGPEKHHCLPETLSDKLLELFSKYHVSHIFTGHIHGYWAGIWDTIPYTITAGAGARLYSNDPAHGFHHYLKVRVKDGWIREEVVAVNKTLLSLAKNVILTYVQIELQKSVLLILAVFFGLWSAWRLIRLRKT